MRNHGVTAIQTGHAPEHRVWSEPNIKTSAQQAEEALVPESMLTFSLGGVISGAFSNPVREPRPRPDPAKLFKAADYAKTRGWDLVFQEPGNGGISGLIDGRTQALVSSKRRIF